MKKNTAIVVTIILFSVHIKAQNPADDFANMKKYWFYHYRLVNDFLVKGDQPGESLPMGQRALGSTSGTVAKWGDATICLAQYISVLATEYKLLRDNGQPTDTTLQELYYALNAFNRLDYNAEINTSGCFEPNTLNGFFMRDDVPSDFLDPVAHPKHQKLAHGVTSSRPINSIDSDFKSHADNINNRDNEMSHDQVWHLMMGFALVTTCIPDATTYNVNGVPQQFLSGNTNIRKEAIEITDRIIMYMKFRAWLVLIPGEINHVARGYNAAFLSYGAAEAANFIKYGNNNILGYLPVVHRYADKFFNYHDQISFHTCNVPTPYTYMGWARLTEHTFLNGNDLTKESFKYQNLATIGNSWYTHSLPISILSPVDVITYIKKDWKNPFKLFKKITQAFITSVTLPTSTTLSEVSRQDINISPWNYLHFPLLFQALHGGSALNYVPQNTYTSLLNSAPPCGPYNYGPNNTSTYEWSADSRVYDAERRGEDPGGFQGEFNGLDYMLYYNLYHLAATNTVPTVNYMDRVITFPFPTTDNPAFGTTTNPANLIAFNTITATNTINTNTDVTYRADNEIALLPNFSAQLGSNFNAYISPISCDEYSNPDNRSTTPDYTGQTTFVNYPKNVPATEYSNTSEVANLNNYNINNKILSRNADSVDAIKIQRVSTIPQSVSGILINPNPSSGVFQIMVTHNNQSIGVKELKVYDIMGRTVWSTGAAGNAVFNVDISGYLSGIYYVRSVNELGEIEIKKLIKQ